jgi:hypothetical protein
MGTTFPIFCSISFFFFVSFFIFQSILCQNSTTCPCVLVLQKRRTGVYVTNPKWP